MNKNNLIGIVVVVALLIGWSFWMAPSKKELAAEKRRQDSLTLVRYQDSIKQARALVEVQKLRDSLTLANPQSAVTDSAKAKQNKLGAFASADTHDNKMYTLENEFLQLKISSKGGRIFSAELKDLKTFDSLPVVLFSGDTNSFGFEFNTEDLKTIHTNSLHFEPVAVPTQPIAVSGNDSTQFALRLYVASDSTAQKNHYIEYVYTLYGDKYMVGFKVNFVGMENVIARNSRDLALQWNVDLLRQEKNYDSERDQSTIYYMDNLSDVEYLSERKPDNEKLTTPVKWISCKQQFFATTLISKDFFKSAEVGVTPHTPNSARLLKNMQTTLILGFDPTVDQSYEMSWYLGPAKYKLLKAEKLHLERQIPLGWSFAPIAWFNTHFVVWVFNWLETYGLNYGIIILIMTFMLRIILYPLAYKSYLSMAKMRLLKPEIDEISAKFPKKEDAMKKQQATMQLYKKAGVSPMAGCLPMLLQFPILIAMFRFFPAAFELRQQAFLWASDLSTYDSILSLPFKIPFYGDHVSLFTLLMTISTLIYTKINNQMMGSTNQMPGMKTMMYIMPIMFLGFFNNYSAGLSYYYLLANLFSFAQTYIMKAFLNEDKLHAKIQANKAKPVKKSAFQKRLDEIAKQQQQTRRK